MKGEKNTFHDLPVPKWVISTIKRDFWIANMRWGRISNFKKNTDSLFLIRQGWGISELGAIS